MKLSDHHIDALNDILKWRRDVRHFHRDPIDPAVLDRLRRSMESAPSVGNARPWRVIQVNSASHRSRIVEIFEVCNSEAADTYDSKTRHDYLALKLAGLREA
jgi:5,6-dimethylbenzimidazole synthase